MIAATTDAGAGWYFMLTTQDARCAVPLRRTHLAYYLLADAPVLTALVTDLVKHRDPQSSSYQPRVIVVADNSAVQLIVQSEQKQMGDGGAQYIFQRTCKDSRIPAPNDRISLYKCILALSVPMAYVIQQTLSVVPGLNDNPAKWSQSAPPELCSTREKDVGGQEDQAHFFTQANDVKFGSIPEHLPQLTQSEQMIIARVHVYVEVRQIRAASYRGHVCHFAREIDKIWGQLLLLPDELTKRTSAAAAADAFAPIYQYLCDRGNTTIRVALDIFLKSVKSFDEAVFDGKFDTVVSGPVPAQDAMGQDSDTFILIGGVYRLLLGDAKRFRRLDDGVATLGFPLLRGFTMEDWARGMIVWQFYARCRNSTKNKYLFATLSKESRLPHGQRFEFTEPAGELARFQRDGLAQDTTLELARSLFQNKASSPDPLRCSDSAAGYEHSQAALCVPAACCSGEQPATPAPYPPMTSEGYRDFLRHCEGKAAAGRLEAASQGGLPEPIPCSERCGSLMELLVSLLPVDDARRSSGDCHAVRATVKAVFPTAALAGHSSPNCLKQQRPWADKMRIREAIESGQPFPSDLNPNLPDAVSAEGIAESVLHPTKPITILPRHDQPRSDGKALCESAANLMRIQG
ncbi:hypothetical protein F4777DRAFT_593070 [Nemania sp. FL0916]|nr:hypothetical protein F4777DRAFT_593070 [Nemania sp. FL0916]